MLRQKNQIIQNNSRKHLKKLNTFRKNINQHKKLRMRNSQKFMILEILEDMISLIQLEIKLDVDHVIQLHLHKLLNQD